MRVLLVLVFIPFLISCSDDTDSVSNGDPSETPDSTASVYQDYLNINLDNLDNYENLGLPQHYADIENATNTPANNPITDAGATLGRVLFYDKNLSINNAVSCASCHNQNNGFDDPNQLSTGFEGGLTGAHAMRLLNAQFYLGTNFFWDRRAETLEDQTTQPIQNEVEMGFDPAHGGFNAVIEKMSDLEYYPELFNFVYGTDAITEDRVQRSLAQFIRAMVSVDSDFDNGFAQVYNPQALGDGIGQDFPNYNDQENLGKSLFINPPNQGGVGCAACHQPPSFALNANSRSNGLDAGETTIFKSPSLKSAARSTHFMHDGRFASLDEVIEHYNNGIENGPALDNRLREPGTNNPLRLNLTENEKDALVAFIETLSDGVISTANKFTDPFIE